MAKIKVLVVEDKMLIAEDIASRLAKHAMEVVAVCDHGEEAVKMAEDLMPDLILMDIELAGKMDGIEAATIIQSRQEASIIYLSDFVDAKTVNRAKLTLPDNYLAKPFNEADLVRAIELAFHRTRYPARKHQGPVSRDYVFLRTDSQAFVKIATDDILYLKADRAYCKVITTEATFVLSKSMNQVFEELSNNDFLRVHRSYVINLNKITHLEGNVVSLGTHEVQISKEQREELMSRLKIIK